MGRWTGEGRGGGEARGRRAQGMWQGGWQQRRRRQRRRRRRRRHVTRVEGGRRARGRRVERAGKDREAAVERRGEEGAGAKEGGRRGRGGCSGAGNSTTHRGNGEAGRECGWISRRCGGAPTWRRDGVTPRRRPWINHCHRSRRRRRRFHRHGPTVSEERWRGTAGAESWRQAGARKWEAGGGGGGSGARLAKQFASTRTAARGEAPFPLRKKYEPVPQTKGPPPRGSGRLSLVDESRPHPRPLYRTRLCTSAAWRAYRCGDAVNAKRNIQTDLCRA